MAQNTSKIHVKISDYGDASTIMDTYNEDNQYLINLIKRYVPVDKIPYININKSCSSEDRRILLKYGRTIKGVAKKMLKSKKEKKSSFLEKKIEDEQLILPNL